MNLGPQKRKRRTRQEIETDRQALLCLVDELQPATVRQVFYQAVSRGITAKTETEYHRVGRLLTEMRLDGTLPFSWITDHTRKGKVSRNYDDLEQALEDTRKFYRKDLWQNQEAYVEVWCEKDALSGVLWEITGQWDVPLMVSRGYASISFLHSAALSIKYCGKPAYLYYFGDHDPSGLDIERSIQERLRQFGAKNFIFERVAVTPAQIEEWNLPTRPTKASDSRAKGFEGGSVEVDAIAPPQLRKLAEDAILQHVDREALNVLKTAEASERNILGKLVRTYQMGDQA